MQPINMSEKEFKQALSKLTTAEGIFVNAPRIYDFLRELFRYNCEDSTLREWAFQWYSEQSDDDYDNIYKRWLNGG